MFNDPQCDYPFPHGFLHGLSLIENPDGLPDLFSAPGRPLLSSWASMDEVVDNVEVFCTGQYPNGNYRNLEGFKLSEPSTAAILAGTEYVWDCYYRQTGVAILWRSSHDYEPAAGLSGSPLCLGRPTDKTAAVICFQNLQSRIKISHIRKDTRITSFEGLDFNATFKVGFVLPEVIRKSTIISTPSPPPPPTTLPRSRASSTGDASGSFHSDQSAGRIRCCHLRIACKEGSQYSVLLKFLFFTSFSFSFPSTLRSVIKGGYIFAASCGEGRCICFCVFFFGFV